MKNVYALRPFAVCFVLLFLGVKTEVFGQDTLELTGRVLDEEDAGVVAARVILPSAQAGAITDEEGRFQVSVPNPPDSLRLVINHPGFKKYRRVIVTAGRNSIELRLQLTGIRTEEVVVSGRLEKSTTDAVVSLETLSSKDMQEMGVSGIDGAMRNVPGFSNNGNDQVSIRGSSGWAFGSGSRVITLYNSLPLIDPGLGAVQFDLMPTENLQQVEVFKGASSVLYGSGALGGVINAIAKDPGPEPKTSVRVRSFIFDRAPEDSAEVDGRSSRIKYSTHAFHSRKIGENFYLTMQMDYIRDNNAVFNDFEYKTRAMVNLRYDLPSVEGLTLRLNTQIFRNNRTNPIMWDGYPDGVYSSTDFNQRFFASKQVIDPSISYTTPSGKHRFQLRNRLYFYNQFFPRSVVDGQFNNYYNEFQHTYYVSNNISIVSGLTSSLTTARAFDSFGKGKQHQLAAFTQIDAQLTRRLSAVFGARYQFEYIVGDTADADTNKGRFGRERFATMSEPIFRGGLNYRLGNRINLRASIGQAVRSPSIAERFIATQTGGIRVTPNPEIQLEEGFSAELGWRYTVGSKTSLVRGHLDVAGFLQDFNNMVEFFIDDEETIESAVQGNPTPAFHSENVPDARIAGGEFTSDIRFHLNDVVIGMRGGVTFLDPKARGGRDDWNTDDSVEVVKDAFLNFLVNPDEAVEEGQVLPKDNPSFLKYRSRWQTNYTLDFQFEQFSVKAFYRYKSPVVNVDKLFLIDNVLGQKLFPGTRKFRAEHNDGYHVVDLAFHYRSIAGDGSSNTLSFFINNVSNTIYAKRAGVIGAPRHFGFQYKIVL